MDPKLKKVSSIGHTKKQASDFNGHLTSERMTHQDQRTNAIDHDKYSRNTGDDSTFSDKYKKKNMRQESKDYLIRDSRNDVELPPVSGVTFPSVKGAEGEDDLFICYVDDLYLRLRIFACNTSRIRQYSYVKPHIFANIRI